MPGRVLRAILSHPWRVLDPEEADVFYVPMYPVLSFKLELGGVSLYAKEDWARTDRNRFVAARLLLFG